MVIFASLDFYDYYRLVSVDVFGFICALTYQSTGSLIDVVALHMFYNYHNHASRVDDLP